MSLAKGEIELRRMSVEAKTDTEKEGVSTETK